MERIYILGDTHTVTALRLAGVEGRVADRQNVDMHFSELLERGDAGVIVITRELAEEIPEKIYNVNLNSVIPVIVEIPGIDDPRGFSTSILDYITEALGISI
ncbi:MAG: V-type ATP synthase subunit F [Deltaproteobacteria bacterium]|nr:MAG: V-type ATP synthase subunit F [Deltaproteobacteria bacterium]